MTERELRDELERSVTGNFTQITKKPVHVAVISEDGKVWRVHYRRPSWARKWANRFFRGGLKIVMGVVNDTAHDKIMWKYGRYSAWHTADDWTLTPAQMAYIDARREAIELAYETDDMPLLRRYEASQAYRDAFGDMTWDEAYDRYECMPKPSSED